MTGGEAEADAVEAAYHAVLARLGAQALQDALALWQEVPALPVSASAVGAARGGLWLATAVRYITLRRRVARALAIAGYRLVRALRTGSTITIATPGQQTGAGATIGALHREFIRLSGVSVPISLDPRTPVGAEPIDSGEELARLEHEAQREAEIVLEALGPRNLATKLRQLPEAGSPVELVDAQRAEAHKQAGMRQAAAVERLVRNGARSATWSLANNDQRVLGYVRYSTTGTPCGWCAMLISRGPVYKTADSAKSAISARYAEGDLYHDNCRCDAKPVYSRQQYDNSTLFELNRTYSEMWPTVTRGLSGKAAVSAWRRFIRQQTRQQTHQQDNPASSTAAREAAA